MIGHQSDMKRIHESQAATVSYSDFVECGSEEAIGELEGLGMSEQQQSASNRHDWLEWIQYIGHYHGDFFR